MGHLTILLGDYQFVLANLYTSTNGPINSPFFSKKIDHATPGTHLKFLPCPTEYHRARQFQSLVPYTPKIIDIHKKL